MLDNLALMFRAKRMEKCLRGVSANTQKIKRLKNDSVKLKREYEQLRAEVKRLRRGEKV
jgi:hypothetical protein